MSGEGARISEARESAEEAAMVGGSLRYNKAAEAKCANIGKSSCNATTSIA
jgi:hypothetical protein